jgi:hypothetical protein
MPSRRRKALIRGLILLLTPPAVAGCALTRPIQPIPSAFSCLARIPQADRGPVAATPLPALEATAGALWIALDDQTARLNQANGRAADMLSITEQCEAERAKAAALPARGFWDRLRP